MSLLNIKVSRILSSRKLKALLLAILLKVRSKELKEVVKVIFYIR